MTLLDCDFTSTLAEILDSNLPSIRWNALDGSTICIHDLQSLVTDVLPSFYFHDNYVKFYRDLRSRGFRKISSHKRTHGALVEFYHPEFTRDIIDGVNDAEEEEVPEEEQQHIQGGFLSISQLKAMQEAIVGMGLMVQEMLHGLCCF